MQKHLLLVSTFFFTLTHGQLVVSDKIHQQMRTRENPPVLLKNQINSDNSYIYIVSAVKSFESGKNFKASQLGNFYRFSINNIKSRKDSSLLKKPCV